MLYLISALIRRLGGYDDFIFNRNCIAKLKKESHTRSRSTRLQSKLLVVWGQDEDQAVFLRMRTQ